MATVPKQDKAAQQRARALEVDLLKRLANYRLVKICLYAVIALGTMYIIDVNDYVINIPGGIFVFLWNGASTTFFSGESLFSIEEVAAYLRFGLVCIFYLAGFMAWNANRMNKPAG